jgi:hypothetical protein
MTNCISDLVKTILLRQQPLDLLEWKKRPAERTGLGTQRANGGRQIVLSGTEGSSRKG